MYYSQIIVPLLYRDIPGCLDVAQDVKRQIEDFRPYIPLIQGLRNPGMRNRHWEQLSTSIGMPVYPKANLSFAKCLEMGLQNHIEAISKVAEIAGKEFSIEQVYIYMYMYIMYMYNIHTCT